MKKIILFLVVISLFSCSSGDESIDEAPIEFAMTAKIDSDVFEANSPWGNNGFSEYNIYVQFPDEDFVLLQGREGGLIGTGREINIWLKKSDIVVGTYSLDEDSFDYPAPHAIDLIDNSNDYIETTTEGTIVIVEVDTTNNIVKGTFEFSVLGERHEFENITYQVTDGSFNYVYE